MAKFSHITPIRASSAALVVPSNTDELLDAYSTWLFFERHFLHIGRFGLETAVSLIDTVLTNNTGAKFHLPPNADLPEYTAPARRAGLILSTVGFEVDSSKGSARGSRKLRA